jgi:hypothetical protein
MPNFSGASAVQTWQNARVAKPEEAGWMRIGYGG